MGKPSKKLTQLIYIRTSTGKQDGAAQLHALRSAAKGRRWSAVREVVDQAQSGKRASRPGIDKVRQLARAGDVHELLVTAIDRLGRNAAEVCTLIDELAEAGVIIHSLREGTIDPKTPMGRFAVSLFSAVAEMEHGLITERVRAGQERARVEGTRSGRPIGRPKREVDEIAVRRLRKAGRSWREIAMALKVPRSTLRKRGGPKPPTLPRSAKVAPRRRSRASGGVVRK